MPPRLPVLLLEVVASQANPPFPRQYVCLGKGVRAFYVDELTMGAPAEALPDKDVDIVLTHEEAQRIADQLFPWL